MNSLRMWKDPQKDESKEQEKYVNTRDTEARTDLKQIKCKCFNTQIGCIRGKLFWFSHENKLAKQTIE